MKNFIPMFFAALFALPLSVKAEDADHPASDSVRQLIDTAKTYKNEYEKGITAEEKASRAKVREKISSILDLKEMAHLILKNHWAKLKDSERTQYADLLSSLVEKIGYPQIAEYFNKDIRIEFLGEKELSENNREVMVRITYPNDEFILYTSFMIRKDSSSWRVYDVITDGDSLLLIYRNQHMGIIKEKGFGELIRLMKKKLASAENKK